MLVQPCMTDGLTQLGLGQNAYRFLYHGTQSALQSFHYCALPLEVHTQYIMH